MIKRLVLVDSTICLQLFFLSLPFSCFPLVGMYSSTLLTSGLAWDLPWSGDESNTCARYVPHPDRSFKCACMDWLCLYQPLMFYSPLWEPHALHSGCYLSCDWNGKTRGAKLSPEEARKPWRCLAWSQPYLRPRWAKSKCLFLESTEVWELFIAMAKADH